MTERRPLTKSESNAIAYLRFFSCLMIISCHYLQAFGNAWAFVLNSGVQIFLVISGFLYGVKGVKSISKFYTGRLKKIYLPYVLWTLIVAVLLLIWAPHHFTIKRMIAQFLMIGTLDGQTHLWFIPILFMCYIAVPLFDKLGDRASFIMLLMFIALLLCAFEWRNEANYIWIMTYFIGYFMGRFRKSIPVLLLFCGVIMMYLSFTQLSLEMFQERGITGRVLHVLIGIIISCLLLLVASQKVQYLVAQCITPHKAQ